MSEQLQHTPLYQSHLEAQARIVPFAGWSMPVQYPKGIIHEVNQVRSHAGIFDVSHMARLQLQGEGAAPFLDTVLSIRASELKHGQAKYNLICDYSGGIIDDAIVYNLQPHRYLLVVNAANVRTDLQWLLSNKEVWDKNNPSIPFTISDITEEIAMIAIQGPKAIDITDSLSDGEAGAIPRFKIGEITLDNERVLAARTGYTGEDGFEIMCDAAHSPDIWKLLADAGAEPCGLGARDVLRLEAGLLLHGSDMTQQSNPYQVGLAWTVKPDRPEYIARDALQSIRKSPQSRTIIGIIVEDRAIPREGNPIYPPNPEEAPQVSQSDPNSSTEATQTNSEHKTTDPHQTNTQATQTNSETSNEIEQPDPDEKNEPVSKDTQIGTVTSGTYSPTLKAPIAIAIIDTEYANPNTPVTLQIRNRTIKAKIKKLPFHPRR